MQDCWLRNGMEIDKSRFRNPAWFKHDDANGLTKTREETAGSRNCMLFANSTRDVTKIFLKKKDTSKL